ncbi:sugar phosphate isomerase/epimerase [Thermoactinomyces sp. CICC 10521]|uniref:sugar phosphate isomerase/epimerase family protein n=1 Tax=Thermoactinomyces sp. CICC 10521 TaxID=2767426 RepID=UPI0018DC3F17|nr:sugar phosphate isomerase/epimerase [Thermoactinomyces sp. CICC 10521]MBH8609339.1 sugar phosphate isomerase/epimerase [Thermoactinomyces sp. CICC 10521]
MCKIALQLWTLNNMAEKDFLGTLRRVADLGYEGVEFAGFFEAPAMAVKKMMEEKKLTAAGSHVPLSEFAPDRIESVFRYHEQIGNRLLVVPWLPQEMRTTADDFKRLAETFNQLGQQCKEAGFMFAYHNHDFEFQKFGGLTGFDILFTETDPQLVKMELDIYWAEYSGFNAVQLMKKYRDSLIALHLKDMKRVNGKAVSTEVGAGSLDIPAIVALANEWNLSWLIVEQEEFDYDPMRSVHQSLAYLQGKLK